MTLFSSSATSGDGSWGDPVDTIIAGLLLAQNASLPYVLVESGTYSDSIEVIEEGICIWDEGTPIKEEEREKIFRKGFRGESGSKMSGSGIGLALARDLARQLGGDLQLLVDPSQFKNSLPDSGNAFVFNLEPK